MSLNAAFESLFQTRAVDSKQLLPYLGLSWLGGTSGTLATSKTAFTLSAFYNGVDQLSNDVAKLPKSVKRKVGAYRNDIPEHPVNYLISQSPNALMTSFDFFKVVVVLVIIKGNAFARIKRNAFTAKVESFTLWNSEDVKVYKSGDKLVYDHKGDLFDAEEVLHFKHFTFDGIMGISLISFAAKQLGISLDSQDFQQTVYKDRGMGYGVIESDLPVKKENKIIIEESFSSKMASASKFKVPMLDEGMKYKSISVTPAEAQFLESNKAGVLDVARWLNIAPHKLKDLTNANYSNIQQQSIEHIQDSMLPWIMPMEQEINRKVFSEKEKADHYVKFNEKVLLRGDLQARKDFYTAMVYSGNMTRNEVRALEDMNPLEGLDEPLQPVNMQALSLANQLIQEQNGNSSK